MIRESTVAKRPTGGPLATTLTEPFGRKCVALIERTPRPDERGKPSPPSGGLARWERRHLPLRPARGTPKREKAWTGSARLFSTGKRASPVPAIPHALHLNPRLYHQPLLLVRASTEPSRAWFRGSSRPPHQRLLVVPRSDAVPRNSFFSPSTVRLWKSIMVARWNHREVTDSPPHTGKLWLSFGPAATIRRMGP